ncbi:MAG: hypothetical protein HYV59_04065 [Planctomycetes bacterium]|nr:hypothetical protein [Planctomycetota bacterium]
MREAMKYLNNAKEILKSVPVEDNVYTNMAKDALKSAKTFIEKIPC